MPTVQVPISAGTDDRIISVSGTVWPPEGTPAYTSGGTEINARKFGNPGATRLSEVLLSFDTGSVLPDSCIVYGARLNATCTFISAASTRTLTLGYFTWGGSSATADYAGDTPRTDAVSSFSKSAITATQAISIPFDGLLGISRTGLTKITMHISGTGDPGATDINFSIASLENTTYAEPILEVDYCIPHKLVTAPFSGVFSGLRSN